MFKCVWRVFVYVASCQEESPRDVHYCVDKVRIYDKIIIDVTAFSWCAFRRYTPILKNGYLHYPYSLICPLFCGQSQMSAVVLCVSEGTPTRSTDRRKTTLFIKATS